MKNQALLLADEIQLWNNPCARAAAELRRLHEANQAMLEALAEQPPQRTWVGLTDEEIQTEWVLTPQNDKAEGIWFGRRIEAKLRSKNT